MMGNNIYLCCTQIIGLELAPETIFETDYGIITNSSKYIFENLITNHESFFPKYGELDTTSIRSNQTCIFHPLKMDDSNSIHYNNNQLATIISGLWEIRDNSVSISSSFYIPEDSNNLFYRYSSTFSFSNAKGESADTLFSETELLKMFDIYDEKQKYLAEKDVSIQQQVGMFLINSVRDHINYNDMGRIERSLGFLHSARKSSILPVKISNYVQHLECLFSTSSASISETVSTRISNFLHYYDNSKSKLEIKKDIKNCYDIRSKYVHGDKLKNAHSMMTQLLHYSEFLDNICRFINNTIYSEQLDVFDGTKGDLNNYFSSLV